MVTINEDEKYAIIAIPGIDVDSTLPEDFQADTDLWTSRSLPFAVEEHWEKWIGSLQMNRLNSSSLFLITKGPSAHPEILDNENEELKKRIYYFYWGLLLSGCIFCDDKPLRLTGANSAGRIDVRSIGELDLPRFTLGCPRNLVNHTRLRDSVNLANNFLRLITTREFHRYFRACNAFYKGILDNEAGNRLHQFIRCIEGFIYPDQGATTRQFSSRMELFLGPHNHSLTHELYNIRSSVEHLHVPSQSISVSTERGKRMVLLKRAMESEQLARYCIQRVLTNQDLWPYFTDDAALENFWGSLTPSRRRELWGAPFNIDDVSNEFDPTFITDKQLGL